MTSLNPPSCLSLLRRCLAVAGVLWFLASQSTAWAITRIGNREFGSDELGFTATLSESFDFLRELQNDGALLISSGDGVVRSGEPIVIRPLDQTLTGVESLSQWQFEKFLLKLARPSLNVSNVRVPESCVSALLVETQSELWGLASWGKGVGVVFKASNEPFVRAAIVEMLASIRIAEEACQWPKPQE
jgi:hypothetical protein